MAPQTFSAKTACPAVGYVDNGAGGDFYAKFELVPHRNDALGFSMKEPKGTSRQEPTGGVWEDTETFGWSVPLGAAQDPQVRNNVGAISCSVSVYPRDNPNVKHVLDRSRRVAANVSDLPHGFLDVHPEHGVASSIEVERAYEGEKKTGTATCSGPASHVDDMKSMVTSLVID